MRMERRRFIISGQVQGVGFRPFVYRIAHSHTLTGHVSNSAAGLIIEVQGATDTLAAFAHSLYHNLPPLAHISRSREEILPLVTDETAFSILHSAHSDHTGHDVRISPDVATCADCLADMQHPHTRRFAYPFTNCTNCGPRYTITRSIPYDRATTSMACFVQCPECQAEYDNPADRRFHAQPNACSLCGPHIWTVDGGNFEKSSHHPPNTFITRTHDAIAHAVRSLRQGSIVAIKGLGGFHLACDALQADVIAELRRRKHRPHKPLAIMVRDVDTARKFAHISEYAAALLHSVARPVVLCPRTSALPPTISPDTPTVGIMLPYTPLHYVLFDALAQETDTTALVMTSGNAGGEPICLGNREALARLASLADVLLLHNRNILVRVDDSVLSPPFQCAALLAQGNDVGTPLEVFEGEGDTFYKKYPPPIFHRRARGYVPSGIALAASGPTVLGTGAELKATLCLTRTDTAFVSQHIGDIENLATYAFYEETAAHMQMLLEARPLAVACDMHPDFLTSRFARELAQARGIPLYTLQHHVAHAWSVLAENQHVGPALAWVLDGAGYGEDGTVWGGELLWIHTHNATHRRLGRCAPFVLPGGDAAVREPWRIAQALLLSTGQDVPLAVDADARHAVTHMVQRNIRCVSTSSAGRLFDAVSAVLGLCTHTTYEGQAAVCLEAALGGRTVDSGYTVPCARNGELWELSSHALFAAVVDDIRGAVGVDVIARRFHAGLVQALVAMASAAASECGVDCIGLSGGVMQNAPCAALLMRGLERAGLRVLIHKHLPANDGGLSLGQAAYAQKKLSL